MGEPCDEDGMNMSEPQEGSPTGIKRLEKKKGRLWGFMLREEPGKVTPLPQISMTRRLRHLMMSSIKTTGSYMRNRMGDGGLRGMFEHQANEFADAWRMRLFGADQIARDMIRYNFQPLGMEAEYSGDNEVVKIVVTRCPLPQRFLQNPEFLAEIAIETEEKGIIDGLRLYESLTAKGEWPPKSIEACSLCKIVVPKMGERLGFAWEHSLTDDQPPRCVFILRTKPIGH